VSCSSKIQIHKNISVGKSELTFLIALSVDNKRLDHTKSNEIKSDPIKFIS